MRWTPPNCCYTKKVIMLCAHLTLLLPNIIFGKFLNESFKFRDGYTASDS